MQKQIRQLLTAEKNRLEMELKQCQARLEEPFYPYPERRDLRTRPEYCPLGILAEAGCPNYIPWGARKGIAICVDQTDRRTVCATLEKIVMDILSRMDPGYYDVRIMDPERLGRSFPHLTGLGIRPMCQPDEIKDGIEALYGRTKTIVANCLNTYDSLDEYNAKSNRPQPYRFLVAADFPSGLKSEDLNKIRTMLNIADEAGMLLLMTFSRKALDTQSSRRLLNEILGQLLVVDVEADGSLNVKEPKGGRYDGPAPIGIESPESLKGNLDPQMSKLLESSRTILSFDILDGVRIPIGVSNGATHYLTFGHKTNVHHCFIAGQSGSGKTVTLHNIIARGMAQYTKDELSYVLLSCAGTGLQEYEASDRVLRFLCSNNVEECADVVRYVKGIQEERERLFKEANVDDIKKYVKKTGKKLPRIIFLIDEFHILFSGKERLTDEIKDILVGKFLKQGRKYGIHLITATQSLGEGVRTSLLANFPLRIALNMIHDQSTTFLESGNTAAVGLKVGEAIYNDGNGKLSANRFVQIDHLQEDDIKRLIGMGDAG